MFYVNYQCIWGSHYSGACEEEVNLFSNLILNILHFVYMYVMHVQVCMGVFSQANRLQGRL